MKAILFTHNDGEKGPQLPLFPLPLSLGSHLDIYQRSVPPHPLPPLTLSVQQGGNSDRRRGEERRGEERRGERGEREGREERRGRRVREERRGEERTEEI